MKNSSNVKKTNTFIEWQSIIDNFLETSCINIITQRIRRTNFDKQICHRKQEENNFDVSRN